MDAITAAHEAERAAEVALSTFMFSGAAQYTTEKHIALCNALTEARDRTTAAERAAASLIFGHDEPTAAAAAAPTVTESPKPIRRSKRIAATADKRAAATAAQAAAAAELDSVLKSEVLDKLIAMTKAKKTKRVIQARAKYVGYINDAQQTLDETLIVMEKAYAEFKKDPSDSGLKYDLIGYINWHATHAKIQKRITMKIQEIDAYLAQP
jgi:hypothetical protein